MRVNFPGAAKPMPWDRHPVAYGLLYNGTVGPHGATQRIVQACPADMKLVISSVMFHAFRPVAAAPSAEIQIRLLNAAVPVLYYAFELPNVDDDRLLALPVELYFEYGDTLIVETLDGSTGGTVTFNISLNGVGFDAQ